MNTQQRQVAPSHERRSFLARAGLASLVAPLAMLPMLGSCSGGTAGDRENRGPFKVSLITTGTGQIFPYQIRQADPFGNPTTTLLNIENLDVLKNNVTANNPVLPVATFDTTALLPNGSPGNQYLLMQFTHRLDEDSIIANDPTNSFLTSNVSLLTYDPNTEATAIIPGRTFVAGMTYFAGNKVKAVEAVTNASGQGRVMVTQAAQSLSAGFAAELLAGFPGVVAAASDPEPFSATTDLVSDKSIVFIPDADTDLSSFETYPTGTLLRLIISNAVRDSENDILEHEVCTATTVGPDTNPPDVLGQLSAGSLNITPGNGQSEVDPTSSILVRFNKPVQPNTVGEFFSQTNLVPSAGGMTISVTVQGQVPFAVTYYADPLSFGDFCNYTVKPSYILPGLSTVDVTANNTSLTGLNTLLLGNTATTQYTTADGPGIVNAPVAPEAIYIGVGGAKPGVSVIDLNGFGQGTGDPALSRFALNPNVGAPGVVPALAPTQRWLDAGGAGALTLTQDTKGETLLLRAPIVGSVGDIQIGAPLDLVFNNENININATRANQVNPLNALVQSGNTISAPPHPNPPRLIFPPPNPSTQIFGESPTIGGGGGAGCITSPLNLLTVGNPFALTKAEVGVFGTSSTGTFTGPQPPPGTPPPPTPFCPYSSRQQIGHFLYVLDSDNRQVLVVNSNRMTVLDTIRLPDPSDMTVSPNMTQLAVSNFSSGSVSFVDINPLSGTFHQIVAETRVDPGPSQVAYQPDGEDLVVISTSSNTATLISGLDFSVRKIVSGFLNSPIDVACTERYSLSGNLSTVYYAYILNADGSVAIYESGPAGVNGFGFDDIIATVPNVTFKRPRKLRLDYNASSGGVAFTGFGAVFVAHVDESELGQVSRLALTSSPVGVLPVQQNQGGFISPPTFRQKEWTVIQTYGGANPTTPIKDQLSGNTVLDMSTDEMLNFGALPMQGATNVPLPPWGHSGKGAVQITGVAPFNPKLMFVALGDVGKVDVFDIGTGQKLRTLDVPGVRILGTYWKQ